ncbi:MAG: hypothetical protein O2856_20455 [Planctomycetota bacterium]|nr:hypothetical protein [Planctomycetota bacterium]
MPQTSEAMRSEKRTQRLARECPYCHEPIPCGQFDDHVKQHTALLPDGQMTNHQTLPEQFRTDDIDIKNEPQVYIHRKCGAATGMPTDIIPTYLVDPCFYNGYTFCAGCGNDFHQREFNWEDTQESLHAYNRRLFRQKSLSDKLVWALTSPFGYLMVAVLGGLMEFSEAFPDALGLFVSLVGAAGLFISFVVGNSLRLIAIPALRL